MLELASVIIKLIRFVQLTSGVPAELLCYYLAVNGASILKRLTCIRMVLNFRDQDASCQVPNVYMIPTWHLCIANRVERQTLFFARS